MTRSTSPPTRLLFFNEGNLGANVLGHTRVETMVRAGAAALGDGAPELHFAALPPQGRWARAAAVRPLPLGLGSRAALSGGRWHLVQALRTRREFRRAVERVAPAAVHVHSHTVALALDALDSPPVALSVDVTVRDWWGMPAWRTDGRRSELAILPSELAERRLFARAPLVLAWTPWARRAVLAAEPRTRVVVHHPGIDLTSFRPAPRRPRDLPRLLFVGGRFADKGGDHLLRALGDDLGRTVELDVVTPADVAARPGLRVHRLGAADPALLDLRQQADLFCLPSGADSFSWALLEAMACGTPVVGSAVGGLPDLIGRDAGSVVPFAAPTELAAAIRSLLADPGRLAAAGAAARHRCEQHYDAAVNIPTLLGLLEDLAAR